MHSQVLQNVAVRIDLAFKAFLRRVKAGETPGFPRFRGADRYDSFTFPQSGFSITHDHHVCLSKVGSIKMVYHRPVKGTIKTCTISRTSTGKWYGCFSVECEPQRLEPIDTQVGIDVGLKTFASLSDASEIENPRFFRKEEKALAKSISDAAWSQFFDQLSRKAEEAGRAFIKVNPAYTSQDCSRCHHRQKMPLGERVYQCPCCHLVIDRDHNASLNIRALGLQSLGIQPVEAPAFTPGE